MQIHHIVPRAGGGAGDYDNGIPVCLDCHAEVESRSNMGRWFTAKELRLHRDRLFTVVRERPEALSRSHSRDNQTGPLEALLAELDFNRILVSGPADEMFPPLADSQFERAVAANAMSALPPDTREDVQKVYRLLRLVNARFAEMVAMDRSGGRGGAFAATQNQRNHERAMLLSMLPPVIERLARALGEPEKP